jgi:N-acetylglutamate synthase-like GNAT family acetyltransferase
LGTQILADEQNAVHVMAVENDKVLGVARMHESAPKQGQVRCVAVASDQQGKGVGKAIMLYLENQAQANGWHEIVLEARENAVPFYTRIGYQIEQESYLLFGEIQHYRMKKALPLSE